MLYGIMLVYYTEFYQNAIKEFDILLKSIDKESKLIIVSNNENIPENYIRGNNLNWEFTGWDEGLKYIQTLEDEDSVIFANDTFMYNNPYGKLKSFFIRNIFKYSYFLNKSKPQILMSGSTCGLKDSYTIKNTKADYWVSTYLFFMSGKLINKLDKKISLEESLFESVVALKDKKLIFNHVSENMQIHLQEWLYPTKDVKKAWYKALNVSDEVKLRKVKTIINEKYLSSYCISSNGKIIDINPKKILLRLINKSYV